MLNVVVGCCWSFKKASDPLGLLHPEIGSFFLVTCVSMSHGEAVKQFKPLEKMVARCCKSALRFFLQLPVCSMNRSLSLEFSGGPAAF